MTIKTLVIGLGKIGMMYDYDDKKSSLSHSQSINKHPHFFLSGAIDSSSAQRNKFFKKVKILEKQIEPLEVVMILVLYQLKVVK